MLSRLCSRPRPPLVVFLYFIHNIFYFAIFVMLASLMISSIVCIPHDLLCLLQYPATFSWFLALVAFVDKTYSLLGLHCSRPPLVLFLSFIHKFYCKDGSYIKLIHKYKNYSKIASKLTLKGRDNWYATYICIHPFNMNEKMYNFVKNYSNRHR